MRLLSKLKLCTNCGGFFLVRLSKVLKYCLSQCLITQQLLQIKILKNLIFLQLLDKFALCKCTHGCLGPSVQTPTVHTNTSYLSKHSFKAPSAGVRGCCWFRDALGFTASEPHPGSPAHSFCLDLGSFSFHNKNELDAHAK